MSRAFSLYLDAVRFLAASMVMLYHANWIYRPGYLITSLGHEAVVIFFVLSGFVIAYVTATREQDFRGFMVARGARIFSVAIPAIVLTVGLDYAGFSISEAAYPVDYRAWDLPLVRIFTSTFFLNEIWTLGIQLFTNVPYWSLNYEVWYYVLFGLLYFVQGRKRWWMFLGLCLFLGPKIILLLPIWWLGVWVYNSKIANELSVPMAWLCFIASILTGYWYVELDIGQWGWGYLQELVGPAMHVQMSFSRQFISDYYLGLVLALHFAGLRVLLKNVEYVPQKLESAIRYLAGATFSIYLFHQPLLWFYSAVFWGVEEGIPRYLLVLPLTFFTTLFLAIFTEHKKALWMGWVEGFAQLLERLLKPIWTKFRSA
ncbi:MAG: peptidoglycan/LPS O-acetylase OafA/YrhL [Halioglobus sp.]|jgi:peptidoglycan/LPS O-acetylase OafA/YrhL